MKNRRNSDEINDDADENGSFTPPFLPLEESNPVSAMSLSSSLAAANTTTGTSTSSTTGNVSTKHNLNQRTKAHSSYNKASPSLTRSMSNRGGIVSSCNGKKVVSIVMLSLLALVIWDAVLTPPERRWIKPDFSETFLLWVQDHPIRGLLAFLVVIAVAVVFMVPIGTPLTLGCGYVYKGAYGWKLGLTIATAVSMAGSALGAVVCFLLGRYLMRDQVRTWIRKYPLFDAIDAAAAEHGLRIMAMLYLTPILPLGPVSYMCGTTSMALSSFVLAKIASLPLMLLYAFIGASTGALLGQPSQTQLDGSVTAQQQEQQHSTANEFKSIEENQTLILSGICLSFVMIAGITHNIKRELNLVSKIKRVVWALPTHPVVSILAVVRLPRRSFLSTLTRLCFLDSGAAKESWRKRPRE
jgi:uncharacterized membrane protein YdjX (TVP38/TMEM64 family)